jgi:hypothetical protein
MFRLGCTCPSLPGLGSSMKAIHGAALLALEEPAVRFSLRLGEEVE